MVGFEGWLCWVLGLFTVVRERLRKRGRGSETKMRDRGERWFWVIYILLCKYIILMCCIKK